MAGGEISNDQMSNDQYFEIKKLPILKITGGPDIQFFYLRNFFFFFSNYLNTQIFVFLPISKFQFFIIFQISYFFNF